jgi:uncharacterized membrane protein YfcA
MMQDWLLAFFFMAIAFTYASVGFGGGSSYLALMAFSGLPFLEIRLTALICNIIVVSGGALVFSRYKQIDGRKMLPILVASVPLAFLGAQMRLSEDVFFRLLGVTLLLAASLLWFQPNPAIDKTSAAPVRFWRDGLLGGSIGCLSGMVGIGGGIFLSPLLHFFRWDTTRKIAAAASVFILVNSLAGIAGQIKHLPPDLNWSRIALLGAAVLIGGQMGSRISMVYFTPFFIRRLTAVLVFVAGVEVLLKH